MNVKFYKTVPTNGSQVGSAYIKTSDNFVIIAKVRVKKDNSGYFLSYPSYQNKKGEWKDYAYCMDKETNEKIVNAFLETYPEFKYLNPNTKSTESSPLDGSVEI